MAAAESDSTAEKPRLEGLLWMVGSWSGTALETFSEELWIQPAGGVMLGLHRDVASGGQAFFEYLDAVWQTLGPLLLQ